MQSNSTKKKNHYLSIGLFGMYGAGNLGDDIISEVMFSNIKALSQGCNIDILTYNKKETEGYIKEDEVNVSITELNLFNSSFWKHIVRNINIIKKNDLYIIGGGGLIQDNYSIQLIASVVMISLISIIFDKPFFIIGTNYGPFRRKWAQNLLKRVLKYSNAVILRDEDSAERFNMDNPNYKDLYYTSDIVLSDERFDNYIERWNEKSNKILFILRDWEGIDIEHISLLVRELIKRNYNVEFDCYEKLDRVMAEEIVGKCSEFEKNNINITCSKSMTEAYNNIISSKVVISMRFHGIIMSASVGVPLIPIYYEEKVKKISEQLEILTNMQYTSDINVSMVDHIEGVFNAYIEDRSKYIAHYNRVRGESKKTFLILENYLKNDRKKHNQSAKFQAAVDLIKLMMLSLIDQIYFKIKKYRKEGRN